MSERLKQNNQTLVLWSFTSLLGLSFYLASGIEFVWLAAACFAPSMLQWWFVTLTLAQAAELRRTHVNRPPPLPDPPALGKNKRRAIRKVYVESLRRDWYAKRLANKRKGKSGKQPKPIVSPTAQLVGILLIISILIASTGLPFLCQLWDLALSTCAVLGVLWLNQLLRIIGNNMDSIAGHSRLTKNERLLLDSLLFSIGVFCFAAIYVILSFLFDSTFEVLDDWCSWLCWWIVDSDPVDIPWLVFRFLLRIETSIYRSVACYQRQPSFTWWYNQLMLCIRNMLLFILVDSKDAWLEGDSEFDSIEKLKADLEQLLGQRVGEPWDWQSLSDLQEMSCISFQPSQDWPQLTFSPISEQMILNPFTLGAFFPDENSDVSVVALREFEEQTNTYIEKVMLGVSPAPSKPRIRKRTATERFLKKFNPATAGADLLMVERYDQRRALKKKRGRRQVSVDMHNCLKSMTNHIISNVCTFPAFEEFALNITGPSDMPLILDSGASCCISPCKDDFIEGTYRPSDVKIKDLSGSNTVAGKGMLRWPVKDKSGRVHEIEIQGYHVPQASVRLLSPQSIIRKFGGKGGFDEYKFVLCVPKFNLEIHAPYGLANLPIIPMSSSSNTSLWSEIFLVSAEEKDIWGKNIMNARNQNLSPAQKEILLWHQKLSHAGLSKIHNLCRLRKSIVKTKEDLLELRDGPYLPCNYNVPNAVCDNLLCAACAISKATRRKPTVRTAGTQVKEMSLKEDHIQPGDCISCDHYISPVPGRVVAPSGHSSTTNGYVGGTLYVDHASGWIFHRAQRTINASDTIRGKLVLEREAAEVGVKIKAYHSDNGVFSSKEFKSHCTSLGQDLTFSGVGAKFQNGVAERGIGTVCNMARANMLHATLSWPGMKFISFWALAMSYAIWCYNRLPPSADGSTPEELWSKNKSTRSTIKRARVFGCPVYVLDPKLQDGKSIPKWNSKARQGIFVGFSESHSSTVALVYNPTTQHISPQYHVIFDDTFSTVPSFTSAATRDKLFEQLYDNGRGDSVEYFIDSADADAGRVTDNWRNRVPVEDETSEGDEQGVPRNGDSEGVAPVPIASEGASDGDTEGAAPIPIVSKGDGVAMNPLHRNESRPVAVSEDKYVSDEEEHTDSPRYNLRKRTKTALLTNLLTLPQYVMSAVSTWAQQPAAVANVGTRYAVRNDVVKRAYINELALLSGEWDSVGKEVAFGIGAFTSYMRPDLFDDDDDMLVEDVQPHVLKAKASLNDADNPTYTQAMNSPDADKWADCMKLEVETLVKINAWTLFKRCDVPQGKRVLPMKWAFKLKRYPNGLVNKFKARFCVRGDRQIEGIDFNETWAPVVQWTTVRAMIILAAKQKLCTAQADITAAFVHAPLEKDEEIFVEQPKGLVYGEPGEYVLKLNKSVYGIKQAPRNFFKFLVDELALEGLQQSENDPCLFVSDAVIAIVYVDDILFFSKDDNEINRVINNLASRDVQIRREGSAEGFLGVDIARIDKGPIHQIKLTQSGLTKRIVEALGLCSTNSTAISTPAEAAPLPKDVDGAPSSGNFNYAAVIGMMLYLSGHSRPDIAFAVHQCARYTFNPTRRHEIALIRIGRYLKGTMNRGLIMTPSEEPKVDCYPDADFAGLYGHENAQDPHCARSRTGYVILAFGCPVLWRSKLQTEIALSTMEAEYVAISTSCRDLFPVVDMIKELSRTVGLSDDFVSKIHVKIHEDNVGALTLGKLEPRRMTPRSKHYAIKYHWFREKVADPAKRISLVKIDTKN
jgi:hypothetical protein